MKELRRLFILVLLAVSSIALHAQGAKINGRILEKANQKTVPGVMVIASNVNDSTERHADVTDEAGNFSIKGLKFKNSYKVKATYLGFKDYNQTVTINAPETNLGAISMSIKIQTLNEVIVEGQAPPAKQKGDTTELNASAFKVNPDANAQELVQKMPGVTIENGTVKAHGEDIKRVMIDGKNYFGEDPAMALQNLPAEVVDKVQIYNKMSDQAEFTGFDDGQSSKVMNIITRADRRNGTNGLFTAGTDFMDKYAASGRFNYSKDPQRITLVGGSNNVNQQNFSSQDLLGGMSGGSSNRGSFSGRSRGGSFSGGQSGLNKTHSFGLNYTNALSKKVTLTGSYFFNGQDNNTEQLSNIDRSTSSVGRDIYAKFENQSNNSNSNNYNHRFDMRLEYAIDSANSIIWSPRFSSQQNNKTNYTNDTTYNIMPNEPLSLTNNSDNTDGFGLSYTSDLVIRHKFKKKGRTISLGATVSGSIQNSNTLKWVDDWRNISNQQNQIKMDSTKTNLKDDYKSNGETFSSNLAYTEPIGINGLIQVNYNVSFNNNNANKYSYDQFISPPELKPELSNVYKNKYNTQRAGISYRFKKGDKLYGSIGTDYQQTDLSGERTYPQTSNVDKTFSNILPNAQINYKFSSKANLRLYYRTSTNPPSINQLQDVVTVNSVNTSFSLGNPNLKHEYANNLYASYKFSNPEKFTNFGLTIFGNYTQNSIGTATYVMSEKTAVAPGDTLNRSGQLTKPVNFDNAWSGRAFLNYGFLFQPIKCNLNFIGGAGYTKIPGSLNDIISSTNQYNFSGGLVIGSNISQNVDFTLSYNASYTLADISYSSDVAKLLKDSSANSSNNTWYQGISFRANFIWKNFVLQSSAVEQINTGLSSGYNQSFLLWNIALGRKLFKNNSGEIKISVFDVLNRNQNVTHSVASNNTSTDTRTNTLQRFFLLTFTYNLRNYKAPVDDHEHHHHFGGDQRPF